MSSLTPMLHVYPVPGFAGDLLYCSNLFQSFQGRRDSRLRYSDLRRGSGNFENRLLLRSGSGL